MTIDVCGQFSEQNMGPFCAIGEIYRVTEICEDCLCIREACGTVESGKFEQKKT